eukprot:scaffold8760_cov155-Amphora_coffeaeformis.AAC.4
MIVSHEMRRSILSFVLVLLYYACCVCHAYDNGLGLTPPMGWNSWNHFGCQNIHQDLIQQTAQALVELGLDKLGYQYINLDDCWQKTRNETGYIQEDFDKFPSGIPALRDYVVEKLGLKFGLYSDAGIRTCAGRPGGLGYETRDADTYAAWKIDYLKYDNCFNLGRDVHARYQRMHDALNATGRPIFFSICEWGKQDPAKWAGDLGNAWRTTQDIEPTWNSFTTILDQNNQWYEYAHPGAWNDPDMLEVGNGQLTMAEQRAHFTLWCLIKSPLLLGNDLRNLSDDVLKIINNTEVIAWNQDKLGKQGYLRSSVRADEEEKEDHDNGEGTEPDIDAIPSPDAMKSQQLLQVWAGELSHGHIALVLFNRSDKEHTITAPWSVLGLTNKDTAMIARDVWHHQDLGIFRTSFTALVQSHGVVAIELRPTSAAFSSVRQQ